MIQGQQNWSYHHTENAWPIVHAFLPRDKALNGNAKLKQKLEMIQNVEFNNHLRGGVVNLYVSTDISWMIAMHRMGYKYAVVWFEGVWPANEEFNMALLREIDRMNAEDDNWMIAAQLRTEDPEVYAHISRSMVIINLATWMEHKTAPFWEPAVHPAWENFYPDRDWEDSAYSLNADPDWSYPDRGKFEPQRLAYQENMFTTWLQYSFVRRLTVWGISDTLMEYTTQLKPHIGTDDLESGITGGKYQSENISFQGRRFIENTFNPTSPIYFVNTEPSHPNYAEQLVGTKFGQYAGATAGFKLLYYAYKYGIDTDTNFVWYDFDPASCVFKRDTLKHWNGKDYPAWVELWCHAHPGCNEKLVDLTHQRWPQVIDQFGGPLEWQRFWDQVKSCQHDVVQVDLIRDPQSLIDELQSKRTFLWTSNIYSYIIPKLLAKPFELERSFMNLIDGLNNVHNDCWFSGTDVNDADLMCPSRVIFSATDNTSIGLEE